ncbi:pickpocket protein 28-like isoform X2 [Cylas formicarius]|uniref:pickpocket protein 28-like isoform X2 n=1 Tax=Cylas formicarius TaxID=197179 RepID=UPI002958415A|nr:pickpocket protein 28-like isoform X2 [Cylas formicarius]
MPVGFDRRSLVRSFFENTTFPACRFFAGNVTKLERIVWAIVLLGALCLVVMFSVHIFRDWTAGPIFITLEPSSKPIDEVEFPGVAICDINVLSNSRVTRLAERLKRSLKRDVAETAHLLRHLGNLYTWNVQGMAEFNELQNVLEAKNFTVNGDASSLLLGLSTPCGEMLSNCVFDEQEFDCATLFHARLTDAGFCCVFNNVRPLERIDLKENESGAPMTSRPRKFAGFGPEQGLSVTIGANLSDYSYTILETQGYLLKIFSPHDYADALSGSLSQVIVAAGQHSMIKIDTDMLISEPQIKSLPQKIRNCKYPDEGETMFGNYTSSDCFVNCKINSIMSLCNCVPFLMPVEPRVDGREINFCNLIDVPCLNKYKEKWSKYYPSGATDRLEELLPEMQESLSCDCASNCDDTLYYVDANYFDYLTPDPATRGVSKVTVFANNAYANLYRRVVTVTWQFRRTAVADYGRQHRARRRGRRPRRQTCDPRVTPQNKTSGKI